MTVAQLTVRLSPSGRIAVVSPHGELDVAEAPSLRACLLDVLPRPWVRLLIVDLVHVTFLDLVALGVLEEVAGQGQRRGTTVSVTNAHGVVAKVIRLAGSAEVLGVRLPGPAPEELPVRRRA